MRDISWMQYLMIILASYRFTHLIVFDKITEFLRLPFMKKKKVINHGIATEKKVPVSMFGYLLNCYWCAGVWSSIFIVIAYMYLPKYSEPFILVFSVAGAAAIIETFVGVGTKYVSYLSKQEPKG